MTFVTSGPFKPIVKNFDIEQYLMLAGLAYRYPDLSEFKQHAIQELPQSTRKTRLEWTGRFQSAFLAVENKKIIKTPALQIWASDRVDIQVKRQLMYIYYLRKFPLIWHAVNVVVYPRSGAEATLQVDNEIPIEAWDSFLQNNLVPVAESSFIRVRNHFTSQLSKFGLLESSVVGNGPFNKKFFARTLQPLVEVMWFSLGLEFHFHGWTSRTVDFIAKKSWTRIAFCAPETFMRWALDEAVRLNFGYFDYYGSEKQFAWRDMDIPQIIADKLNGTES